MNAEQIQQELAKCQAKMLELQAKYADPTPENIVLMQQEMAGITQKMNELSLQYATAITESYGVSAEDIMSQAFALADSDGFEIDDLFGDNEDEKQEFAEQHPVAADKEKYLPIGALLLSTHDEPWRTLALMADDEYWQDVLEGGWGIEDIEEGREMLNSLLDGRHTNVYGEDYRKLRGGQSHELDEDSVDAYNDTLEALEEDLPELLPYAQNCDNILAWDIERVGYLARIFCHLGWIDEAETWEWIEKAAGQVKANFSCWEEYIASILMGRAVAFSFDYVMIGVAQELVDFGKEFLDAFPISEL